MRRFGGEPRSWWKNPASIACRAAVLQAVGPVAEALEGDMQRSGRIDIAGRRGINAFPDPHNFKEALTCLLVVACIQAGAPLYGVFFGVGDVAEWLKAVLC